MDTRRLKSHGDEIYDMTMLHMSQFQQSILDTLYTIPVTRSMLTSLQA
jgi:hypothetical protein